MGFFQGIQERVPNSRGKRAIRVRVTEGLRSGNKEYIKKNDETN